MAWSLSPWVHLSSTPLMRARRALEIVKYYNIWKGCYKQLFSGWRPSYWTPNTFPDLCLSCKHCITKLSHRQMYSFAHCNGTLSSSGQIMKITMFPISQLLFRCFFVFCFKSWKASNIDFPSTHTLSLPFLLELLLFVRCNSISYS